MGNKLIKNIIFVLGVCSCFSACKKLDFSGMIISDETANKRFEQSVEWNTDHSFRELIVPSDDYIIFSMSDSHVGGTNNLDAFMNIAVSANAVAVVMAGDLTTGHAEDYTVFQQHLPNPDSIALFPVVGNHDLFFDGWEQFYSRFGSSVYIFTVKTPNATDLYICLDSGSGTLGSLQIDWLKDILENVRPNYRRCVLITHNDFFRFGHAESTNPLVEELHVLMELFVKHNVDMLIAGHDHQKDAEVFGNTTYIVMDALLDDNSDSGYLKINVINGNIEYQFVSI